MLYAGRSAGQVPIAALLPGRPSCPASPAPGGRHYTHCWALTQFPAPAPSAARPRLDRRQAYCSEACALKAHRRQQRNICAGNRGDLLTISPGKPADFKAFWGRFWERAVVLYARPWNGRNVCQHGKTGLWDKVSRSPRLLCLRRCLWKNRKTRNLHIWRSNVFAACSSAPLPCGGKARG